MRGIGYPLARIRHYLVVYREFLSTCFAEATSFRLHFVLLILMDLCFYGSSLASVDIIFNHVERIGVWSREEFLFFVSFMLAVDYLHMTFISHGFWDFSFQIRTGGLDFLLLKPIGSIFTVFFRHIRPATLVNFPVPCGCLIWFGSQAGLEPWAWPLVPVLILLALVLLVSLEILLSISMFWTVEAWGINFLRMQFQQMARWPDFIYKYVARKFFTILVPVLLVGSAPVKFLFDASVYTPMLGMLAATGVSWVLIRIGWRMGLRSYESASS